MSLTEKPIHPKGEQVPASTSVETFGGKVHIEWDSEAPVTPVGQILFFIQFLKLGGRFDLVFLIKSRHPIRACQLLVTKGARF